MRHDRFAGRNRRDVARVSEGSDRQVTKIAPLLKCGVSVALVQLVVASSRVARRLGRVERLGITAPSLVGSGLARLHAACSPPPRFLARRCRPVHRHFSIVQSSVRVSNADTMPSRAPVRQTARFARTPKHMLKEEAPRARDAATSPNTGRRHVPGTKTGGVTSVNAPLAVGHRRARMDFLAS